VLFYQADRNWDAVRIELQQLENAFAAQPQIYNFPRPSALENIRYFHEDYAR
jgi:hypothetical protein